MNFNCSMKLFAFNFVKQVKRENEEMNTNRMLKLRIKNKRSFIFLLSIITCIASVYVLNTDIFPVEEKVVSSCNADLDTDGIEEELYLTGVEGSTYGKDLVIRTKDEEIGRYDLEALKPWKVQVMDVDGDGVKEISIGVYKTAKFHPVMAKRPFIYNWDKEGLSPKWLGSRLSRPFDDYIFSDIDEDGMEELISIELLSNGRKVINSYKWKGFGFEGMGESRDFQEITELQKQDSDEKGILMIGADIRENGYWKHAVFSYQNGKLIEQ